MGFSRRWASRCRKQVITGDFHANVFVSTMTGIANLSIQEFQQRVNGFKKQYIDDWDAWLATKAERRAFQLGVILRRWQACRPNGMRRTRAENQHEAPYLEDLIEKALPNLQVLHAFDIRVGRSFSSQNLKAMRQLWQVFEDLSYWGNVREGRAGVVGISKAVLLLTKGRIGPAFDSTVRRRLRLGMIGNADAWIEALETVSCDIRRFETANKTTLEMAVPDRYRQLGSGRIYDMALGPRE